MEDSCLLEMPLPRMPKAVAHGRPSVGVFSFASACGPLPEEVLNCAQADLCNWRQSGVSILTLPFNGAVFREILAKAEMALRTLLAIPEDYRILFMHGGASAQFAIVPLNLLRGRKAAHYVDSGYWSGKAITEARRYCKVNVVASSAATDYDRVPELPGPGLDPSGAYCHIVNNETANGIEYHHLPDSGEVPLVADMTSNFLSRPVDIARYGLIYAGTQKNIGVTGLAIIIVRKDLVGSAHPATPTLFDYGVQAEQLSLYNTPPTFAIYVAGLVFEWLLRQGGVGAIEVANLRKSAKLYAAIELSRDFYRCCAHPEHRSRMNVCFRLANETLTSNFVAAAAREGLFNLGGHPSIGGVRASLYNAVPEEGVDALIEFMEEFARRNG